MEDKNKKNIDNKDVASVVTEEQKIKPRSKASKITGIIGKIILWLIIISSVAISIRALVFKKYDVLGCRFYLIMSGSMEPTIMTGDAVITKETDTLKQGDIVAFSNGGAVTVHRIITVQTGENGTIMYETKGDNNNATDGLMSKEQVKGVVIARIPYAGTTILFIKNHFIIFIWIIIILIFAILARRLI